MRFAFLRIAVTLLLIIKFEPLGSIGPEKLESEAKNKARQSFRDLLDAKPITSSDVSTHLRPG